MKSLSLLSLVFISALFLVACSETPTGQAPSVIQEDDATVTLEAPTQVAVGDRFEVDVTVNDIVNNALYGFQYDVQYDSSKLDFERDDLGIDTNPLNGDLFDPDDFCVWGYSGNHTPPSITNIACISTASQGIETAAPLSMYKLYFTADAPGSAQIELLSPELIDKDQNSIGIATLPVVANVLVCEDADSDGAYGGAGCVPFDCDDSNPNRYPGNAEVCNGVDNDCDLTPDNGVCTAPTVTVNVGGNAADDQTFSGDVTFTADVTDTDGDITQVEWFYEGGSVETDTAPGPYTYTRDTTGDTDGVSRTVQATVTDNTPSGAQSASDSIDFTTQNNCDVLSVDWDATTVTEQGSVGLTVRGDANCDGISVGLSYVEDDATGPDEPLNAVSLGLPTSVLISGTSGTATWNNAQYFEDGALEGNNLHPDIVIIANGVRSDVGGDRLEVLPLTPALDNDPTIAALAPNSVTVSIQANKDLRSATLNYGTTSGDYSVGTVPGTPGDTPNAQFDLSGLTSVTTYYYEVVITDTFDNQVTIIPATEYEFTTLNHAADFFPLGNPDGSVGIGELSSIASRFRDPAQYDVVMDVAPAGSPDGTLDILDLVLVAQSFSLN